MPTVLQYPPQSEPFSLEVPVWMNFRAANYSTFIKNRVFDYIWSNAYLDIRLPFPKAMATQNSQNYQVGGSMNILAAELGAGAGSAQSGGMFSALAQVVAGAATGIPFAQEVMAKSEAEASFKSGGGVIRFDHLETVLMPGARRTHSFVIDLVAKTSAQAFYINEIAMAFQTNLFPIANTNSIYTMRHPPLWAMQAFGPNEPRYWDGAPLVSVLKSVDINRSPIIASPFTTVDYRPLAVNIKLVFVELEPAMQVGNGKLSIFSRSDNIAKKLGGSL